MNLGCSGNTNPPGRHHKPHCTCVRRSRWCKQSLAPRLHHGSDGKAAPPKSDIVRNLTTVVARWGSRELCSSAVDCHLLCLSSCPSAVPLLCQYRSCCNKLCSYIVCVCFDSSSSGDHLSPLPSNGFSIIANFRPCSVRADRRGQIRAQACQVLGPKFAGSGPEAAKRLGPDLHRNSRPPLVLRSLGTAKSWLGGPGSR